MIYDYLIVGQGIAGSMVAYHAMKRGKSVFVIDKFNPNSASNIATGVVNPVTGRRMAKTWMIDTVLPYAKSIYRAIEAEYDIRILFEQPICRLFSSSADIREWELKRTEEEYKNYLGPIHTLDNPAIIQPYGVGEILQACWVNIPVFIEAFRDFLKKENMLLEKEINYADLRIADDISYQYIHASHIIFCEGYQAIHNPFFTNSLLSHAKGELLEIVAPGLQIDTILNKNIFILPLGDDHYMIGSTFIWDDTDENITSAGRTEMTDKLEKMISVPYQIIAEKAGIRPTMPDRRPVLGASKEYDKVFQFNGLGSKGISLGPYFANHLLDHIESGIPLIRECNINRFKKKHA